MSVPFTPRSPHITRRPPVERTIYKGLVLLRVFVFIVKDRKKNNYKGRKYSKWNAATHSWGMLGRETGSQRGRIVGFVISPVKWTRKDWCIQYVCSGVRQSKQIKPRPQWRNAAQYGLTGRGTGCQQGKRTQFYSSCRWAITSPLLMLPPATLKEEEAALPPRSHPPAH